MDEQASGFHPPYQAFSTFWSFTGDLADKPLPPRIDRSLMRSKSGSDQVGLTAAMKAFGLIDNDQNVTGLRDLAAADEEGRLKWLAAKIHEHYAAQMKVSAENGTDQQLRDSFRESFPSLGSGDTIRKAVTFYLHAARTAKIPLSPYFPSTRSGSGAPGAPKPSRPARKRKPAGGGVPKDEPSAQTGLVIAGDVYTLTMESGPKMVLAVEMNVMTASVDDRSFIFEIVDKMRGYGNGSSPKTSGSGKGTAGQPSKTAEDSP